LRFNDLLRREFSCEKADFFSAQEFSIETTFVGKISFSILKKEVLLDEN